MNYPDTVKATFLERPNRFVAYVELADGKREKVHVKNTGRCRELFTGRARVYLAKGSGEGRSTAYDLVAVEKGGRVINIDSQAPNRAAGEWLLKKELFPDLELLRPETKYKNSRFDFYLEAGGRKIFLEVKGVTLEENGVVMFPDAPSERAVKHVDELIEAVKEGYEAYLLFVVQMKDVSFFTPNARMHPAFAQALARAEDAGVRILAYDCEVAPDGMEISAPVEVRLDAPAPEDIMSPVEIMSGARGLVDVPAPVDAGLEARGLADVPGPLLKWYDAVRRVLPWREEPTPYRVWVSEIMLQQTRVEAVKPYFERFMKALPDIAALAAVPEETLLKLWEGLGYYNRARNLKKAAVCIMENYGGRMPAEYEELLKLPGIGSYTAGAIASIAYGKKVPAVDGNVLRVISRVEKREDDILLPAVKKDVENKLAAVMPDRPGDFNQAMMEIGAMVCIPGGAPRCENCPLEKICLARACGEQEKYPKKSGKKPRRIEKKTVFVIRDEDFVALNKRPERGLLAGLYELPGAEGHLTAKEAKKWLAGRGLKVLRITPLADAKHIFTHKEWHMKGYMVRVDELAEKTPDAGAKNWIYARPDEIQKRYPIPSAFSAYMAAICDRAATQ